MQTEIQTERVHRTWTDRLLLRRRAFQTRIYDQQREAIGRGPTVQASREAALEKWVTEGQAEYEAASE